MIDAIQSIYHSFEDKISTVTTLQQFEEFKLHFLGRKGVIQQLMIDLKTVTTEDRPRLGKQINELKENVIARCAYLEEQLLAKEESERLSKEFIDVTLPGKKALIGRAHPLTKLMDELLDIFVGMGFSVQLGPDIDTDYYNFEALNFSPHHPARDMQDTFYITQNVLLRTHTSNIQVRVMQDNKPPIRIVAPGRAYRNEAITARSHVFFHQIEAVYIDENVSFADLLASLDEFLKKLFKKDLAIRYRPSYFPFVEPGVEVDVACLICEGKGCSVCKHSGWLEILGAGMIHPEVLKNGDIDPERYSGYAWGLGVARLVMIMKGVEDIRLFTENDLRFLTQFAAI